jgi:AsmA-like C-terminal region
LSYSGPIGGTGSGTFQLRDFRLKGETALTAVTEAASRTTERGVRPAGVTGNSDLTFTELRVPFQQQKGVIVINDAALRGPVLGATATGTVNLPGSKIAISGTFIPAFGLNNIAGSIPLLGGILGGGRNEGLFGITYKLFGPIDAPNLTMNPMSAIAPGIFRHIFEYN